jgi:hypothetical protein
MSSADRSLKHRLREAIASGEELDLSAEDEREVPAALLREVLLSAPASPAGNFRLRGARIVGALDLEGTRLSTWLWLENCHFDADVNLRDAHAYGVVFDDCDMTKVEAQRAVIDGVLSLSGSRVADQVDLDGARIGSDLTLDYLVVALGHASLSISAYDVSVGGDVRALRVEAPAGLRLASAHVGGRLLLDGAQLDGAVTDGARGPALHASDIQVDGSITFGPEAGRRFRACGTVMLDGARSGADLRLGGASLDGDGGESVNARMMIARLLIDGTPSDGEPLTTRGPMAFDGATGGDVDLSGAILDGAGQAALACPGIVVDGDFICSTTDSRERFASVGSVSLNGARIGRELMFSGASLSAPSQIAFDGAGLRVKGGGTFSVVSDIGLTVSGSVVLVGAELETIDFDGATVDQPNPDGALIADSMIVRGNARFGVDLAFAAAGDVQLPGCRIAGQLGLRQIDITGTLTLDEADIASLWLTFADNPGLTSISLRDVSIGGLHLISDREASQWPPMVLDGCRYDTLDALEMVRIESLLRWVGNSPSGYAPQPYEQLAAAYARAGHPEAARAVLIAEHRQKRKTLGLRSRLGSYLLDATVAYGYRLSQAGLWLLGLLVVGACLFGVVLDDSSTAKGSDFTPTREASALPSFQPFIYTLDVLLPVIDLGQATAWNAHGAAQWVGVGLALSGWLLTAAFVAGIAVKRG